MTIIDGALYDVESICKPALSRYVFFQNTRTFLHGPGMKEHRKHTNILGHGGSLPRGYSITAHTIMLELEGASAEDVKDVERAEVQLLLAPGVPVETMSGAEALQPNGARLKRSHDIIDLQRFGVSVQWPASPPIRGETFSMKVLLLGTVRVPVVDGLPDMRARLMETYGRKRQKEVDFALLWIHADCLKDGEAVFEGPLTRRAREAIKVKSLDLRGAPSNHPGRNTRKAWWCNRCHDKVKQSDQVVAVRAM